ncbi:MAG: nucleotidyl transferase AbiEii/AbiGii toxin family protein [Flavobacteriaceae bacterium]
MNKFFNIPDTEKRLIFQEIANKTGMPPYAVEKDWWVVQTLALVFELEIGKHLVFKGGTSLSKAWNLIHRFSEDIDLAVDRSFFGFKKELSKKERTNLRKTSSTYIQNILKPLLEKKFTDNGFTKIDIKLTKATTSDQDPRIIEIYYPNITKTTSYIMPRILLEIGSRSLREPFTIQSFNALVDAGFPNTNFSNKPIRIPTVNPERTFLEKLFLLHEEFHRPKERIRTDRLSRHLYDIYQLIESEFAEKAINNKELYTTIVKHRYAFTKVGYIDYNLLQPQTLNPLPPKELDKAWKKDYQTMQEQMIYGDSPSYENMILKIDTFIKELNQVNWKMDVVFPKPKQ